MSGAEVVIAGHRAESESLAWVCLRHADGELGMAEEYSAASRHGMARRRRELAAAHIEQAKRSPGYRGPATPTTRSTP